VSNVRTVFSWFQASAVRVVTIAAFLLTPVTMTLACGCALARCAIWPEERARVMALPHQMMIDMRQSALALPGRVARNLLAAVWWIPNLPLSVATIVVETFVKILEDMGILARRPV